MKWSFGAVLGIVASLALAGRAVAAVDAFLKIEGVKGESQEKPGAIELKSWSFGAGRGGSLRQASSGRAGRGPDVSEIQITKLHDQASPKLMEAAATGRRFSEATLTVRKAGGEQPYLVYKLTDVMISHYQMSSGGDRPTESMTLNFGKMELLEQPQTERNGIERAGMVPRASRLPPPGN